MCTSKQEHAQKHMKQVKLRAPSPGTLLLGGENGGRAAKRAKGEEKHEADEDECTDDTDVADDAHARGEEATEGGTTAAATGDEG